MRLLILLSIAAFAAAQDCTWSINNDVPDPQPLYIKPGGALDITGFWLPAPLTDIVTVPNGGEVLFACPGGTLNGPGGTEATLTCTGNKNWQSSGGQTYSFGSLTCSRDPFHDARFMSTPCEIAGPYRMVEIGFILSNGDFYTVLQTCFDETLSDSIYSVFLQTPEIFGYQSGYPRPSFVQGSDFYPSDIRVDTLYTQDSQKDAVAVAVGSDALAGQYIQEGTDFFLSRGHLTAKADYVYGAHQRATFWFMNVAPQWQTFNGANWNTLEENARTYQETHPNSLWVYTGVSGTTTLADINGDQVPIYLAWDSNTGDGILKVPHIFWKILYDETTGLGVAFGGLNNPYVDNPGPEFYVCPDVCDQLSWITWNPNNQQSGYVYCCEVPAMAAAIPEMPNLPVTGLLT